LVIVAGVFAATLLLGTLTDSFVTVAVTTSSPITLEVAKDSEATRTMLWRPTFTALAGRAVTAAATGATLNVAAFPSVGVCRLAVTTTGLGSNIPDCSDGNTVVKVAAGTSAPSVTTTVVGWAPTTDDRVVAVSIFGDVSTGAAAATVAASGMGDSTVVEDIEAAGIDSNATVTLASRTVADDIAWAGLANVATTGAIVSVVVDTSVGARTEAARV